MSCIVCAPKTKNLGNKPCNECEPCSSNSFCSMGSINEISLKENSSYTQTFTYPDHPAMNNYDDLRN
jgi:hypothetical protein